jgi:DNA-binding transcriptional MerR regulator
MDIAEVAKRTGVPASALRFYEKKGLIRSVGRDGARRRFAPDVVDHLALIALGQSAGLSLDEIRSMLSPGGEPNIDRRLLVAKADEIDVQVRRLQAISNGLRHAAACPAPSHAECPSFRKLLTPPTCWSAPASAARRAAHLSAPASDAGSSRADAARGGARLVYFEGATGFHAAAVRRIRHLRRGRSIPSRPAARRRRISPRQRARRSASRSSPPATGRCSRWSNKFFYWLRASRLETDIASPTGGRTACWPRRAPSRRRWRCSGTATSPPAKRRCATTARCCAARTVPARGARQLPHAAGRRGAGPGDAAFLDAGVNVKGAPNENFAREIMELFTMGVGNYSENDIREAARAFTGWNFQGLDVPCRRRQARRRREGVPRSQRQLRRRPRDRHHPRAAGHGRIHRRQALPPSSCATIPTPR